MATLSNILVWRIPWTEEPSVLQSMGSQRVRHNWATKTFTLLSVTQKHSFIVPWCPWVRSQDTIYLAQHLPRLQSSCQPGCILFWSLGSFSKFMWLLAEIQLLAFVKLRLHFLLAEARSLPLSAPWNPLELLATWPSQNMAVYFSEAIWSNFFSSLLKWNLLYNTTNQGNGRPLAFAISCLLETRHRF